LLALLVVLRVSVDCVATFQRWVLNASVVAFVSHALATNKLH